MRSSFYLKSCLRLWFIKNNSFKDILKSSLKKRIKEEFKLSNHKELEDFLYESIGYVNNTFLSSSNRYKKRLEVIQNLENDSYWTEQEKIFNVDRTSKIVDIFTELEVIGIGRERKSPKQNPYSFKGLDKFIEENRELVQIFCDGSYHFNTLVYVEGKPLTILELSSMLRTSSYKKYVNLKSKYGLDIENILDVVKGKSIKLEDGKLTLPYRIIRKYSKGFILECLLYVCSLGARDSKIANISTLNATMSKMVDLFKCSDEDFLNLIDLSNMFNCRPINLFNSIGISIPDIDEMIKFSHGVYYMVRINNGDGNVYCTMSYLPETLKETGALPCYFNLETFVNLVNSRKYSNIIYNNGIPYLNGNMISM